MKRLIIIVGLLSLVLVLFLAFPTKVYANCDCITWVGGGNYCYEGSPVEDCGGCYIFPLYSGAFDLSGEWGARKEIGCNYDKGRCDEISCLCDNWWSASSICAIGPGFDQSPPECAGTPIEVYGYGKSVTYLMDNPSFDEHGEKTNYGRDENAGNKECTGAKNSGCYSHVDDDYQPIDWAASQYAGVRHGCVHGNDGPQDPNNCDPPEAQCYNQCSPKEGTGQLSTMTGGICNGWSGGSWSCMSRDNRLDWSVSQAVTGLNPGSQYLFLMRSRGRGTSFDDCWGEGWAKARLRSVDVGHLSTGEELYFPINRRDDAAYDSTSFNPTITFYPDDGSPTETHQASSEFSGVQGQNNWYYLGCDRNKDPSASRCDELYYDSGEWKDPNYYWTRLLTGGGHPDGHDAVLKWVVSKAGRIRITGSAYDGDGGGGDGVSVSIWRNQSRVWQKNLFSEGGDIDSVSYDSDEFQEAWFSYGAVDSGWFGGKADDWWRTDPFLFTPDKGKIFVELRSEHEIEGRCEPWSPRPQADWLELIEICDEEGQCVSDPADGIVFNASVGNGSRSEMQLKNIFSDGSESAWGMIANDGGQVTNTNWAPFSPLFFWKPGSAVGVGIRFWNQRDEQQVVVECDGTTITSGCMVDVVPSTMSLEQGETSPLIAVVRDASDDSPMPDDEIDMIDFSVTHISGTDPVVSLNPTRNDFPPADYSVVVKAENVGEAEIWAEVTLNNGQKCDNFIDPTSATVSPPGPWFQTQAGDVHAEGSIRSIIPSTCEPDLDCDPNFSLPDEDTGLPGVVSYTESVNFGEGSVSEAGWLAQSSYKGKQYGYDYFYKLVGSPDATTHDGKINQNEFNNHLADSTDDVLFYEGNVKTDSNWNLGTTKAVLLINGKFLLTNKIVSDSGGSIVIIAKEGIGVSKNVIATGEGNNIIRAVFITDKTFYSSVEPGDFPTFNTAESDKKLVIDGAVIAWKNFNLTGRTFDDNATESIEFYRYDPAILLDSNQKLWQTSFTWQEIAP